VHTSALQPVTLPALRACALCVHHEAAHGQELHCACPYVLQLYRGEPQPVRVMREPAEACGPHAQYLHLAAWGALP
jgi:hypothetical protein